MARTKVHQRLYEMLNVRNILDNGGFEIWQRGIGPWSSSGLVTNLFTTDRWAVSLSALSYNPWTISRSALGVSTYCLQFHASGIMNSAVLLLRQTVENAGDYRGKYLSFSCRIKTSMAGKFCISIDDGITETYSSACVGDLSWETLTVTKLISASSTYVKVYVRTVAPNTQITVGDLFVDNAMLVVGSEPAEFVMTVPAEDLDRCLRYYETVDFGWTGKGICTAGSFVAYAITGYAYGYFSVIKKSTPTLTLPPPPMPIASIYTVGGVYRTFVPYTVGGKTFQYGGTTTYVYVYAWSNETDAVDGGVQFGGSILAEVVDL